MKAKGFIFYVNPSHMIPEKRHNVCSKAIFYDRHVRLMDYMKKEVAKLKRINTALGKENHELKKLGMRK